MTDRQTAKGSGHASRDLEAMWESLLATSWTSLAVLPTEHSTPLTMVTDSFRAVASRLPRLSLRLIDAQGLTVPEGERLAGELTAAVDEGKRVVVVVDSVMWSLAGVPLLRKVEVVLVVVQVGSAHPDGLTSTIGIVGADRIVGSIAVPSEG